MDRLFFAIGSLSGFLGVAFEVGTRYQMYHSFALFVAGTVLFSGSLYALSLSGVRWLGAITPIGGAALLAGWLCMAWAIRR
jgi:uncharacterized membrane protein YgdD (TMEM256/DUF423 family)